MNVQFAQCKVKAMKERVFSIQLRTKKYEIEATVSLASCRLIFWKLCWGKIKLLQQVMIFDKIDN